MTALAERLRRNIIAKHRDAELVTVVFKRPTFIVTGSGGLKQGTDTELAPQKVRLITYKNRHVVLSRTKEEGDIIHALFILLGAVDLDIQIGDHFLVGENHYVIRDLLPNRKYRTIAYVIFFGQEQTDGWSQ